MAQSDDADRPPSVGEDVILGSSHPLCRPAQHSGKRWIAVVEKTTIFRSSAVSSTPRAHHQLRRKSSMATSTTPPTTPGATPDSSSPTNRAYGTANPSPSAATYAASARHQRPASPCPHTPQQPSRRHRIQPRPCLWTHLPSPPALAPSQFHRSMASPNSARPASCTAAEYSNAADQHRPTTSATGRRPAEITTIDHPARSSGRRGRGFKSHHPDALKYQVTGLHGGSQAWPFGVSGGRWENKNSPKAGAA